MLIVEDVYKNYKRPVLNGVSLTAEGGEIIGLAGENGSGKSTLLSIITSIAKPDRGAVTIEGEDIHRPGVLKRWIGYVPQENALFDNLTAHDNIKLWAAAYGVKDRAAWPLLFPDGQAPDKAWLRKKAGQLSGGMKKRLSIAISMMHRPKYLIMDEPSAALDIGFKRTLAETMAAVKASGRSVIFSTHQPDELLLCDRIYVLRDGVFVYEGAPRMLDEDQDFTGALYALIWGKAREPESARVG